MTCRPLRIGVVGLGAGTLAAYGQPGDFIHFFEIDPDVISVAYGKDAILSFIRDLRARIDVTRGEARLALERETHSCPTAKYDVLVLGAFSGDAIPVHLLTRDAFRIHFDMLQSDGILAVHMSNRHVNLEPVLHAVVEEFPVEVRSTFTVEQPPFKSNICMIFAANHEMLEIPGLDQIGQAAPTDDPSVYWTDDHASLISPLRP